LREADLKQLKAVSSNIRFGTLDGFDGKEGVAVGTRLPTTSTSSSATR
jgi:lipoprotein-releasing system permease protein